MVLPLAALCAVLVGTACGNGRVTDAVWPGARSDTATVNPGGGTVQRGTIAVQVTIDRADSATAAAAGVFLSGLPITLTTLGGADGPRTALTDAAGIARFTGLLEGAYTAGVTRTLTPAELATLPASERDVSVFAGGATGTLSAGGQRTLAVSLLAARRGGLVISEVWAYNGPPIAYGLGDYVEVYNNGDTTAYLDGLMLAHSNAVIHTDVIAPCSASARCRVDGAPFWTLLIFGFPGSGRDFPIQPGEAKVIGMDAINHRAASGQSQYQDLSGAQFEQYLSDADTDNPNAANMERVLVRSTGVFGRGFPNSSDQSLAIVRRVPAITWTADTMRGARANSAGITPSFALTGLPASAVLDVFSYSTDPAFAATFGTPKRCDTWTSQGLDRGVADIHLFERAEAMRRRSLGFTSTGREILQDTRNSARDIEYSPPLRRSLNK